MVKSKKDLSKQFPYIVIVSIVAIVGIVILLVNGMSGKGDSTSNIAGEALRAPHQISAFVTNNNIISQFGAQWVPTSGNKLHFTWESNKKIKDVYYVALEMENTYNSNPLGSIRETIDMLQNMRFFRPQHVYPFKDGRGEVNWGWNSNMPSLPSMGTFVIRAYLLDEKYNMVGLVSRVKMEVPNVNNAAFAS